MRSILTAAVILWSLVSHIAVADERPSGIPDEAKYVKVDRVTDGDTIVLMDSTRVRLHGIDTPERDQPYGSEATAALERMVARSVYMVEVDTDRYGRTSVSFTIPLTATTSMPRWSALGMLGGTNDKLLTVSC